jgi:hypothetical protein
VDPLASFSHLSQTVLSALLPQHWVYSSISRRFISPKAFALVPPSNELWVSVYVKLHNPDVTSIGPEHIAALVELLSPGELAVFVRSTLNRLSSELDKMAELFSRVSGAIRLAQPKTQHDAMALFRIVCDLYGETRHPMTGALFNSMRIIGNLTALVYGIECEIPTSDVPVALSSAIARVFAAFVRAHQDLFVPAGFECNRLASHRSFPALWCVLEFLLCSPNLVVLSDTLSEPQPLSRFGSGVVLCAHLLICMAGQQALYLYDAIVSKVMAMHEAQNTSATGEFARFLLAAVDVLHGRDFARVIINPYLSLAQPAQ